MNILIVNAFGNSSAGKTKFNSFLTLIKKIFKKVSEHSGIENFNYIIRNPSNIDEYIFNYYSNAKDETVEMQNRKNFYSLDMIFIEGTEIYSPWKSRSNSLIKLVRLCKLANKVLYAGGAALEILVYYLATGAANEYKIINSKGEIKAIEEINKIPSEYLKGIKTNEIFLDFVTGDLLEYRNADNSWEPFMNIGLHHQISAEKYFARGKFVLNDKFKGKDYIKNKLAMSTYSSELKVKITRQYISHYLVQDCPIEFIVICSLEWFPHYVNVTAKKLQFKTICQSEKGPIVIEHENTIGVAFHAQEKINDSVKILKNFIRKKFNEVKDKLLKNKNIKIDIDNSNKEISPIFKIFKQNDDRLKGKFDPDEEIPLNPYCLIGKVTNSCLFNRVKKVKCEAKHVGQSINNREMIFVENNCINQRNSFRLKSSKFRENNIKKFNNIDIYRKNLSSMDKNKKASFISKTNKSLNTLNLVDNIKQNLSLSRKQLMIRPKTARRSKEIKELDIKPYISPNEKIQKTKTGENFKNILLNKLIDEKSSNIAFNDENEKEAEKDKKNKEDEIESFEDYKSKYPRPPTLNELGHLFNTSKIVKKRSYDLSNINSDSQRKIRKNYMNEKREKNDYSHHKAKFLNTFSENNDNTQNISNKNKKYILNQDTFSSINKDKNKNSNTEMNISDTYKPVINKKYNINNRFKKF